jgi:hypothetical protein
LHFNIILLSTISKVVLRFSPKMYTFLTSMFLLHARQSAQFNNLAIIICDDRSIQVQNQKCPIVLDGPFFPSAHYQIIRIQ